MTPHGPDTATYEASIGQQQQQPSHLGHNTLAFMFETSLTPRVTPAALGSPCIDRDYYKCWVGLKSHFDREWHSKQQQQQGEAANAGADLVEATGGAVMSKAGVS
jgi:homogentisate 1,2-dioxygenase